MRHAGQVIAFRLALAHGHCVGVAVPSHVDEETLEPLHADERERARALPDGRRASWVAGRLALRTALADLGVEAPPLLATDRGAPLLPEQALGSISHKRTLAVALAAPHTPGLALGVDLEDDAPLRIDISRRVLTAGELAALAPAGRDRAVLLHLSAKEAIYKALDPFVRRYVSFQEAELSFNDDGSARVTLAVPEGPFVVDVRWQALPGHLLTSAAIRRG
jgi:enterobactin synthetase component D